MVRKSITGFLWITPFFLFAGFATASDHLDAPMVEGKGGLDVNDLYVFRSPNNPDNTVLVMTVNPFSGIKSPTTFDPQVSYNFLIDNNGDAKPDLSYSATFGASGPGGTQPFLVMRRDNSVLVSGNTDANVPISGGGYARAGLFDDPFFFDLAGFKNGLNFTGTDFFAGANISAIVLEIPNIELKGTNIGVVATTSMGGAQIDRVGRPAINTVLIPTGRKDEFNSSSPDMDPSLFGDVVRDKITALSGSASYATTLSGVLLPDMLTFDTTNAGGFLNGRRLADDVIDIELNVLTNGGLTTGDGVSGNDHAFSNAFPYLAAANVPEPASTGLGMLVMGGALLMRRCRR